MFKRQVKGGIQLTFKDYTEAHISIDNMNPDAELRMLEKETSAFQDTKRFVLTQVLEESRFPVHPYIKPKNSPATTFPAQGNLRFRPFDQSKNKAKVRFKINKKIIHDSYDFNFEVVT